MAKVPVPLRLDPQKLARVDAYAKARGATRQVVLESAVDSFLDDSGRGVPELAEPERAVPTLASPPTLSEVQRAQQDARVAVWARQQKLNEAKERASS